MKYQTKDIITALASIFILIFASLTAQAQENNNNPNQTANNSGKKVTICHIPPGNPENPITITISENALDAHLEHGDTLGACDSQPGTSPTPTGVPTNTPVPTNTATNTPVPTNTATNTPVPTNTATNTPTPTNTATNTPVPTNTATNTPVPTNTATNTPVPTNTATNTPVPTNTATNTPVPTNTATNTPTPTNTPPACQYPVDASDVAGLIEAINLANSDGIFSTICLTNSIYSISAALPSLTTGIEILGDGATISRSSAADYRILTISNATVSIENLTISNGSLPNGIGGGIFIFGGSLTLDNVTVSNNTANFGGGIAVDSAQLTTTNSTISNNHANSSGGGLYFSGSNPSANLSTTIIEANTANKGAGIANDGGSLTIDFSHIRANIANEAGGIYNNFFGSLTITNTVLGMNQTSLAGAALSSDSYNVTVNDSCIIDNTGSSFDFNKTIGGTIDAQYNWWGAVDGPSGAASGSGDSVSTGIDYSPFATTPLGICS